MAMGRRTAKRFICEGVIVSISLFVWLVAGANLFREKNITSWWLISHKPDEQSSYLVEVSTLEKIERADLSRPTLEKSCDHFTTQ
jgi:hypothetical protein